MKFSTFVQAVAIMILFALAASSCRTSRQAPRENPPVVTTTSTKLPPGQAKKVYGDKSAKAYAPGQQKKNGHSRSFPLIIIRTPDIVISKHTDGRYFYKNPSGYYYWQGSDDRFYIDEKHLAQVDYNDDQYNDWKNKGNNDKKENGNSDKSEKGNSDKKQKGSNNGNNGKNKKG